MTKYLVGDFETTVYEGQTDTQVWASALVEMFTEDVQVLHSIDETWEYLKSLKCDLVVYYHNLKFDGSFWLDYLLIHEGYKQALIDTEKGKRFARNKEMRPGEISYSIAALGQWYRISVKVYDKQVIEFRDSLKLLPFSVKKIGKSFGTKHKKLDMEYTGFRYPGCTITEEEKHYISNDVLVVKEALEIMFTEGHQKLTIGSCCLAEYKKSVGRKQYENYFPDLYQIPLPKEYGCDNAGSYIRKSYRGGWCYLVEGKEAQIKKQGTTADVNSLYPSMMSSQSGNRYPIGEPSFWKGNLIPDEAIEGDRFYFVRFRTRFYIKKDMLPFIQIKGNWLYNGTEMLKSSDILNDDDGKYYPCYYVGNKLEQAIVELTMTCTDFELFKKHYELVDFQILDGCYFESKIGIFDTYIEKYKQIKVTSKGAKRELAKLFLNNLYGKMASSPESNFKVAEVREDRTIGFSVVQANDKKPGYIAVGSAITSYARCFTITAAQKNYYGVNERGFIYADTDSIHCDLKPEEIKGVQVHPTAFCCWKLESCWDEGYFIRQKTYVEHITHEDCEPIDHPYYNVKCAGMPENCKNLFLKSMDGCSEEELKEYPEDEQDFLKTKRSLNDFNIGLKIPGKLRPKRIRGGVLLVTTTYEMH